jgi:hypothetical protein
MYGVPTKYWIWKRAVQGQAEDEAQFCKHPLNQQFSIEVRHKIKKDLTSQAMGWDLVQLRGWYKQQQHSGIFTVGKNQVFHDFAVTHISAGCLPSVHVDNRQCTSTTVGACRWCARKTHKLLWEEIVQI